MRQLVIPTLLWFSAIGCGLLGGLYFAFSAFIMTSLGRIGPEAGITAMNAINLVIVRSLFMPVFLGTTLSAGVLAGIGVLRWGGPGSPAMAAGGVLYVIGMFVVTMVFNVPLNDQLAAVHSSSAEAAILWSRYLKDWTLWNHLRTIASIGASAFFIAALATR